MIKINNKWFHTEEEKERIRNSCKGINSGDKNCMKKKEVRDKVRKTMKLKYKNGYIHPSKGKQNKGSSKYMKENNPMFNKEIVRKANSKENMLKRKKKGFTMENRNHSKKSKEKISIFREGKTYEEIMGEEKAKKCKINRKKWMRDNPEKTPNYIMAHRNNGKGFISKPQMELYLLIKQKYLEAELEYPIRTKHSIRFADIAIPSQKLDIEYDGMFWHTNKQLDDLRDKHLKEVGWETIRINKNNIQIQLNKIIELK